jgi:hypothetical protein
MKEKLLQLKVDTTQVLRENTDAVYLTEHDVFQILKAISEEIQKVENPYVQKIAPVFWYEGFEDCRAKILSLLKGGK